jgi:phosphate transport system substrate-binding protein
MARHGMRTAVAAVGTAAWLVLCGPGPAAASEGVRINGSGSALDFMTPLLEAYSAAHPGERFHVSPPLGSSGAVKALLAGALDLAVMSRPLLPEEEARGARAREYGRTPLLIVTHAGVSRRDVTTAELVEIWSGRVAQWGDGERIRPVLRPESESNTKILCALSPGMREADAAARRHPWALVAVTDPEAIELITTIRGSIGAATLNSALVQEWPFNRLSLDGVEGTLEALAQGRYPLAKPVIFVTGPASRRTAHAIVEFAFTAAGRAVAERAGVWVTGKGER